MRVTLTIRDDDVRDAVPYDKHVLVEGPCPCCKVDPFSAAGTGSSIESRDTYRADARCLSCGGKVGVLRTTLNTVFGIEEDERILNGPWKVY